MDILERNLFQPVSGSLLGLFRIGWGLIMLYEANDYMANDFLKIRYLQEVLDISFLTNYCKLEISFKYCYFEWISLPENEEVLDYLVVGKDYRVYNREIILDLFYRHVD
jgi:hypothetical protein